MPRLFDSFWTRAELQAQVGDMTQVAGISRQEYAEGPERGVEVLRFRTGSGLDFDVLPGRGMDISAAHYHGRPLAWLSPTGVVHSARFEPEGFGWLRGFGGGLLATCGLLNVGSPGADPSHPMPSGVPTEEPGETHVGLHGRIGWTPARAVAADCHWDGDDYLLCAQGRLREVMVFGENVELLRRVQATAGQKRIRIVDEVTNHGYQTMPLMLLYHINLGWPVVSAQSRLLTSPGRVEARDDAAAAGLAEHARFEGPQAEFAEQVFYHALEPDARGYCRAAVVNDALGGGFGVGVTWRAAELDQFAQWKCLQRGTYVCGLEPANCRVGGRAEERAAGRLKVIEPGQTIAYDVSLEVLDGAADVARFGVEG